MEVKEFFDNSGSNHYERKVFYSFVSDLSEISTDNTDVNKYFGLLVLCDFSVYSVDELSSLAEKMIDSGIAFVCTRGKDCEKMHDIFDEIIVYREVIENKQFPFIFTTWHTKDTLDDALWYALFSAFPDEEIVDKFKSVLIAVVENEDWNKQILSRLSNIERFNQMMLEEETDNRPPATDN